MNRFAIDPRAAVRLATDARTPVGHQLVAPNSLRTKAIALLLADVRQGRIDEREALRRHVRITEQKVRLLGDRVTRRIAWDLALANGWPDLDDAEYLAVALRQADALVALDDALAEKASGIVPLVPFEALFEA